MVDNIIKDQNFLKALQSSNRGRKQKIIILASTIIFIGLSAVWFLPPLFSNSIENQKKIVIRNDFSLWQTTKGGSFLLFDDLKNRFNILGDALKIPEKQYPITPAN